MKRVFSFLLILFIFSALKNASISENLSLAYEVGLKEPRALLNMMVNYVEYTFDPHIYGIDPEEPRVEPITKVTILLHSVGSGPYAFLNLAKRYQEEGIENLYTVKLNQTRESPVPIEPLIEKINVISKKAFSAGARKVEVSLVGYSLGAIVSAKYIWLQQALPKNVEVVAMISFAGRLFYKENRFSWFSQDVKPTIEKIHQTYLLEPDKVNLYTIWGSKDGIVPEGSVHFQQEPEKEFTVVGFGHLGVIFSDEAIDKSLFFLNRAGFHSL